MTPLDICADVRLASRYMLHQFDRPRLHDVAEYLLGQSARLAPPHGHYLDHFRAFVRRQEFARDTAEIVLDAIRMWDRYAEPHRDIFCKMRAPERKDRDLLNGASAEYDQARDLCTHVHKRTSVFAIVVRHAALACRQRFQKRTLDVEACLPDGFDQILPTGAGADYNVNACFQPRAQHPERFGYAVLAVNNELLRQPVHNFPTWL